MNTSACQLFANLRRKISSTSGDVREGAFLFYSFGAGATLQRCLVTCVTWHHTRTDDLYPILYYLNF